MGFIAYNFLDLSQKKKEGMHILLISVFVKTNLNLVIFFRF